MSVTLPSGQIQRGTTSLQYKHPNSPFCAPAPRGLPHPLPGGYHAEILRFLVDASACVLTSVRHYILARAASRVSHSPLSRCATRDRSRNR